ncbi:hypothetical protein GCM10009604_03270 [Corynebacterium aurimucosum]
MWDAVCGCGGEFCAEVPGIQGLFHACGVGFNQCEGAEAVFLGECCVAGFALFAAKAGGAEVDLV